MTTDILFILTFVLIIAIAIVSRDVILTLLLISLLANIASGHNWKEYITTVAPDKSVKTTDDDNADQQDNTYYDQEPAMYGPFWERYHSYTNGYSSYKQPELPIGRSFAERTNNVDANLTLLAQNRSRDKKCTDGWVTKNADFYKYHYADEFKQSEEKRWWGNSEW